MGYEENGLSAATKRKKTAMNRRSPKGVRTLKRARSDR